MAARLGLIVNPLAGIGGAVGLKGSDGEAAVLRARALGGISPARARGLDALHALVGAKFDLVTGGGILGEDLCQNLGLPCRVCHSPGPDTTATDTRRAVIAMVEAGVDLILFAGGDGTARDVAAVSLGVPILGIPAGVKMYSGVFANSAVLAGRLAVQFLETAPASRRRAEADLLDIDEESIRRDTPAIRLFGTASVPDSALVQRAKASLAADDDGQLLALCRDLARRIEPNCLYIVGPGRTTRSFLAACGLPKTLLGIDVMRDGALVAMDANEADILRLLETCPGRVVVGLLGGQGCLFGRGNQQISGRVLRRVGRDRILVLAGAAKLASLPNGLFVDTGDTEVDRMFSGFIRIETAPGRTALLRIR